MVLLISLDDSSLIIDKLCDEAAEEDTAVVCFYFDFAARNEQSPVNMLGSLLRQLVSGLEEIPEAVIRGFRNQKKVIGGRGLQVSGILKMFQTIATTKRTFICVDALDECAPEHRVVILESLGQIVQGSRNIRIFVTGRSHVQSEVERRLGGAVTFVLIEPTKEGIVKYLSEKLKNDTTPEIMSSTLKANIIESIPEIGSETYVETSAKAKSRKASRFRTNIFESRFLLASLHIEAILRETSIARRRKRVKSVKDGAELGDAYGATLERVKAQDGEKRKLAMAALTWICHAERPLHVDELLHALAVEIGARDFEVENAPSIGTLLSCCQGFITIDKEASIVRLIHFTVQEYLCAHADLFYKPHSVIAETCLTYLNSKEVKNLSPNPLLDYQVMPFLKYSSRYWGAHSKRELSDHARTLALELLNHYEDHVSSLSLFKQVHPGHAGGIGASPRFSGLHCASFFGNVELVTALMDAKSCDINQLDFAGNTPLFWAAENGHSGVIKLLLEQEDADPNHPGVDGQTPVGCAAVGGHEGVVRILLGREDVDPDRPDNRDNTPLSWAANNGHGGVVKLLLGRNDVDPNRPDENDRTPLGCAAVDGHEGVVKLLLDRKDVDPNRPDENDRTPLGCAAVDGHEGVVKILLGRKDVDPNRPDKNDLTPLGCAAVNGHEGVVKILLGRKDVDPNRPDENDLTPLGCAAAEGHEVVVKLLLGRKDVDPNRPDKYYRTPLGCAAVGGHEGVVRLLLDRKDVDPNRPDENHRTPLGCAAGKGHEGVVRLLLDRKDVDPNRPDENDRTPLGCAAVNGHEGAEKLLLDRKDDDPDHPDRDGRTPLGWTAVGGHERVVKLLLERGDIHPDRPDNKGNTPLSWAANNGHEGVVRLLLDREDVDPNRPDENDRTPLGCAAVDGHEGVVKLLLDRKDVDPNRRDKDGRTPLGWATIGRHEGVVKLLLDQKGIDHGCPDKND